MGDHLWAGKLSLYVTSGAGQLNLANPPRGAVSTSKGWGVNRLSTWCTSPISVAQCRHLFANLQCLVKYITLKRFEQKYLLLSRLTLEVVQISPANTAHVYE